MFQTTNELYIFGICHNPRTGNPVLNQPVEWNDGEILNNAESKINDALGT